MNEVQQIERYLSGKMSPGDKLVMDARMVLDPRLEEKIKWQKKTYTLIRDHGRKEVRREIELAHTQVFSEKKFQAFQKIIRNIFK